MKEEVDDVSKKVQIIGGENPKASQDCKTTKKLYKMRQNIDIGMIRKQTAIGQDLKLAKKKAVQEHERYRVPDKV